MVGADQDGVVKRTGVVIDTHQRGGCSLQPCFFHQFTTAALMGLFIQFDVAAGEAPFTGLGRHAPLDQQEPTLFV
jgi:hypothetical protein